MNDGLGGGGQLAADAMPRAAYLHVPFCRHRCGYCNFTVVAGRDDVIPDYLAAVERELSWLGQPREVDTLFFGGGTPSHLPLDALRRLFQVVQQWLPLARGGEFSIEANPEDIDLAKGDLFCEFDVTRVSLGVQSFDDRKLAVLERSHDRRRVAEAARMLRGGIESLAFDLIFATPGEDFSAWQRDLDSALELRPDHLSTYGLTYERGTRFGSRLAHGDLAELNDDLQARMYEAAIDAITAAGFEHYEVSNFARPGHRCRHNETYWRGESYFAFGPGASRYVGGERSTNHRSTTTYLRRVLAGQSPIADSERLATEDVARERLVFGMRMIEGVDCGRFEAETGFAVASLLDDALPKLTDWRLIEFTGSHVRLTRRGLLISDAIWPLILRN